MSRENLVLQLCSKMLSTSQITGIFDHQYIWKESSYILVFYMKLLVKWRKHLRHHIWMVVASCAACSIRLLYFLFSISGMNLLRSYFFYRDLSRECSIWDCHFCFVVLVCVSCPIRLQNSSSVYPRGINLNIRFFLQGHNRQGKLPSEITSFGCVWLECEYLCKSISWKNQLIS